MRKETIEIKSLTIGYKTRRGARIVASDINTKLYSGELTCILGANGVGKSTLLKTLSSFLPKIEGEIYILGKDIASYSEENLAAKVSVVLTEKCDVHNMSVRELVSMGRSPYTGFWGKLGDEDQEIIEKSMREVKIENLADKMIDTLSDGERQKAMLAKALAQDTPIIILDEPTAFLDYPSKIEIMMLLHNIARHRESTIFVSTHDLDLALQLADRIWLMDKKRGITIGTPEDLSLRGELNNFFSKKDIKFDLDSGYFKVSANYHSHIKLLGSGQKYSMIKKALQRNGIEASREVETDMFINAGEMNDKTIVIHIPEKEEVEVESIDDMLDLIIQH